MRFELAFNNMPATSFFLPEKHSEWCGYKNLRSRKSEHIHGISDYLESLWTTWKPYAGKNFQSECQKSEEKFNQRFWEMHLGAKILNQGKSIERNNKCGPDIRLKEKDKTIWIEAIAPEAGEENNPNAVPPIFYEEIKYCPDTGNMLPLTGHGGSLSELENPIRLRYLSAVSGKDKIISGYIAKSIINKDDPVIVAINSGNIEQEAYPALMPIILKSCFGFGDYQIHLVHNREKGAIESRRSSYSRKESAYKIGKTNEIDSAIFLTAKYPNISAIIFSYARLSRMPFDEELMLIHNPFAMNPLPHGLFLNCSDVWLSDIQYENERIVEAVMHGWSRN